MEMIGDDKRIRALFSEARFAEAEAAPSFTSVWHRAQARSVKPRRALKLSFVAATAMLVFALASLAVWSEYSQRSRKTYSAYGTLQAEITARTIENAPDGATAVNVMPTKRRSPRLAAQRRALMMAANRKAEKQAQEIASWQSPTSSLLNSSGDGLFKSLPQLNENANELKSFLPSRAKEKEK